ncbi:hypothetical protein EVG20_g7941, partial [Dentipellis fragilis]
MLFDRVLTFLAGVITPVSIRLMANIVIPNSGLSNSIVDMALKPFVYAGTPTFQAPIETVTATTTITATVTVLPPPSTVTVVYFASPHAHTSVVEVPALPPKAVILYTVEPEPEEELYTTDANSETDDDINTEHVVYTAYKTIPSPRASTRLAVGIVTLIFITTFGLQLRRAGKAPRERKTRIDMGHKNLAGPSLCAKRRLRVAAAEIAVLKYKLQLQLQKVDADARNAAQVENPGQAAQRNLEHDVQDQNTQTEPSAPVQHHDQDVQTSELNDTDTSASQSDDDADDSDLGALCAGQCKRCCPKSNHGASDEGSATTVTHDITTALPASTWSPALILDLVTDWDTDANTGAGARTPTAADAGSYTALDAAAEDDDSDDSFEYSPEDKDAYRSQAPSPSIGPSSPPALSPFQSPASVVVALPSSDEVFDAGILALDNDDNDEFVYLTMESTGARADSPSPVLSPALVAAVAALSLEDDANLDDDSFVYPGVEEITDAQTGSPVVDSTLLLVSTSEDASAATVAPAVEERTMDIAQTLEDSGADGDDEFVYPGVETATMAVTDTLEPKSLSAEAGVTTNGTSEDARITAEPAHSTSTVDAQPIHAPAPVYISAETLAAAIREAVALALPVAPTQLPPVAPALPTPSIENSARDESIRRLDESIRVLGREFHDMRSQLRHTIEALEGHARSTRPGTSSNPPEPTPASRYTPSETRSQYVPAPRHQQASAPQPLPQRMVPPRLQEVRSPAPRALNPNSQPFVLTARALNPNSEPVVPTPRTLNPTS